MSRPVPMYRPKDANHLIELIAAGHCVTVVGLSNFGKSTLLRGLSSQPCLTAYKDAAGRDPLFVYVDCNRMLELTVQGFYEVILRAILEALPGSVSPIQTKIEALYRRIVEPGSTFGVPLAFNDAIVTLMADTQFDVILLLDQFDQVLSGIEPRIFLNMRALKDRYGERLVYVIATVQRALQIRENEQIAEFGELFGANELFLHPLDPENTARLADDIFNEAHDHLPDSLRDYILQMAGGHPGLTQAVAQTILNLELGIPLLYKQHAMSRVDQALENSRLVRTEVTQLWSQLSEEERDGLMLLVSQGPDMVDADLRNQLAQRGIIQDVNSPHLFARLFTRFVQREALARHGMPGGVYLDTDAGDVWVNGLRAPALTDLEYRLLLLMYGRLEKICDKYQIVLAVWGQEYIDEVDDARIEKLVSRLRNKLERNPTEPRYLLTVRGRGYKLTNGGDEPDEVEQSASTA